MDEVQTEEEEEVMDNDDEEEGGDDNSLAARLRRQRENMIEVDQLKYVKLSDVINHVKRLPVAWCHAAELFIFNQLLEKREKAKDTIHELMDSSGKRVSTFTKRSRSVVRIYRKSTT
ncbi:hypothetical protein ZTR_02757 [Talaromyces verruculosus]|nr:hypothetical protein ZTR_02757 [Talaromyces verruculosus]